MPPRPRTDTVYCPFCNASGSAQPCLVGLNVVWTDARPRAREFLYEAYELEHFLYVCPRCGFCEIHVERLT